MLKKYKLLHTFLNRVYFAFGIGKINFETVRKFLPVSGTEDDIMIHSEYDRFRLEYDVANIWTTDDTLNKKVVEIILKELQ